QTIRGSLVLNWLGPAPTVGWMLLEFLLDFFQPALVLPFGRQVSLGDVVDNIIVDSNRVQVILVEVPVLLPVVPAWVILCIRISLVRIDVVDAWFADHKVWMLVRALSPAKLDWLLTLLNEIPETSPQSRTSIAVRVLDAGLWVRFEDVLPAVIVF